MAVVKQWRLEVEPNRAVIRCRFGVLPPATGLVRGDWGFAPLTRYTLGEVVPVVDRSGEVEVAFYPERRPGRVHLRLADGVTDEILWWDSCTLVVPDADEPCFLLADHPGQFGDRETIPAG